MLHGRGSRAGVVVLLCVAATVLLLRAEFLRAPHPLAAGATDTALPGVTLDRVTTTEGPRLMVTSLRGNGVMSSGLRVGDWIEDVDGVPVRSYSALRRDLARDRADPLKVHVRRKGGLVAVAVAREVDEAEGGPFERQDSSR